MERKFHGSESSLYGLFAPGNESAEERKGLESADEGLPMFTAPSMAAMGPDGLVPVQALTGNRLLHQSGPDW